MKERFSIAGLLMLSGLLAVTLARAEDVAEDPIATIEVSVAKEYVARHDNAVIMDVRTPIEYEMSHITGSVNVDVQNDSFEDMLSSLDPGKTYIVHCTKNPADGRSSRAMKTMRSLGFENLYSLEGGYIAWKEAELPLTETSN